MIGNNTVAVGCAGAGSGGQWSRTTWLNMSYDIMVVIEGGDRALVLARTLVRANKKTDLPFSSDRKATFVFRRDPDGKWRCVIDNSYGTELLA